MHPCEEKKDDCRDFFDRPSYVIMIMLIIIDNDAFCDKLYRISQAIYKI